MSSTFSPLLIAGSDTGVGKTILTAALAAYWQIHHSSDTLAVFKPIQCGVGDREYLQATLQLSQSLEQITPLYFDTPVASAITAELEGKEIDLGLIWQKFQQLQQQASDCKGCLLVESLGGLGSPISWEYIVADLARDWRMATVLVVPLRLGAMGQAIANVALATQKQVRLKGIVLSCTQLASPDQLSQQLADWFPIAQIQNLTRTPILGVLPHVENLSDRHALAKAAANLELEYLGM